jgi:hypothetical protein
MELQRDSGWQRQYAARPQSFCLRGSLFPSRRTEQKLAFAQRWRKDDGPSPKGQFEMASDLLIINNRAGLPVNSIGER